jgi:hypothetical protein
MTKFGVFQGGSAHAIQVFEAHEMVREREFVNFLDEEGDLIATVNVGPGQSVRKMTASDTSADEERSGRQRSVTPRTGVWS